MDEIKTFTEEVVLEKKEEKKDVLIEKCLNCGNTEVIPVSDLEHEFGDGIEKHSGMLCECGCFHYLDEDGGLTYEYSYRDVLIENGKVDWKISNN